MATLLTCPSCGKGLPTEKKKRVACPQCGKRMVSATAALTARATIAHREEITRHPRSVAAEGPSQPTKPMLATPDGDEVLCWGTYRAALALAVAGGLLYIGHVALGMFVELQLRGDSGVFTNQPSSLDLVLGTLSQVANPASIVLLAAAACMSCGAPRPTTCRAAGLAACVGAVTLVFLLVTQKVASEQNQQAIAAAVAEDSSLAWKDEAKFNVPWSDVEMTVLHYGERAATTLALILFLVAMIAAARRFGRPKLSVVTTVFAALCVCSIVVFSALNGSAPGAEETTKIPMWFGLALQVGMALWFVVLVILTRRAVARGTAGQTHPLTA